MNYQPWAGPSPIGWFIALIGFLIILILVIIGQMPVMPLGLLFGMAFLSRLL